MLKSFTLGPMGLNSFASFCSSDARVFVQIIHFQQIDKLQTVGSFGSFKINHVVDEPQNYFIELRLKRLDSDLLFFKSVSHKNFYKRKESRKLKKEEKEKRRKKERRQNMILRWRIC